MMGFNFSDPPSFPGGTRPGASGGQPKLGRETNFNVHRYKDRIAPHKKLTVWHVLSGGV